MAQGASATPSSPSPVSPQIETEAPEIPLTASEEAALRQAREAYVAGRLEVALAAYDRLVRDSPQRAVFWNDRGVTLDALGRHIDAEGDYRRSIELYPEYELAHRNLSNCLIFQQKNEEALASLGRAVELRPDYEEAWNDLLALLLARGPTREDLGVARRLGRTPGGPLAKFVLGVVAAEVGSTRAAVRALRSAAKGLAADAALRKELGENLARLNAQVEKALGNALFAREDLAGAVDAYRRSIDAQPADEETWNNLGFAYFSAGENQLSIDCFRRAVEINTTYKHAWYNLAYTYQSVDRLEEAIVAYDKTLECDPLDEVAWNNRGNAEYNLGRYEASIPFFEKAVEIRPDYDIAWNNIGNALNKIGRHFPRTGHRGQPAFRLCLVRPGQVAIPCGRPRGGRAGHRALPPGQPTVRLGVGDES
jgi:tetratricopeptide (TPR) repeat protein